MGPRTNLGKLFVLCFDLPSREAVVPHLSLTVNRVFTVSVHNRWRFQEAFWLASAHTMPGLGGD
eukprot:1920585-Amphidinium_carterae.1